MASDGPTGVPHFCGTTVGWPGTVGNHFATSQMKKVVRWKKVQTPLWANLLALLNTFCVNSPSSRLFSQPPILIWGGGFPIEI